MYKEFTKVLSRKISDKGKKALFKMKLTFVICLLALLQVSANGLAQKITINAKNLPFETFLDELTKQSGYHFLYDNQLLTEAKPVTINLKEVIFDRVLKDVFDSQPFVYQIKNKNILIIPRRAGSKLPTNPIADKAVSGLVTDDKNEPLPGVSVIVKGTSIGTVTDSRGAYSLARVPDDAVLVFSSIGYQIKEMSVEGKSQINLSLKSTDSNLDDVVVVGYGTQRKATITGSISSVKSEDLTAAPVTSTINSLAGRLPGLVSQQTSGQPGADQASISIRGFGAALWIVDGVESDFNNIDPNQIENITILKDGSASIYGARAGNGVILVTTKRGKIGKPEFTLNSSYTLQGNTIMTEPVSSGQYAELTNLLNQNQGRPAKYTPEEIQKYYNGTDPAYPNTNWREIAMKKWAPQTQHNISLRGGSEKLKYFGFIGYNNQDAIWRENGGGYYRYNLQSNIDAKINDDFSLQLLISAVVDRRSQTARGQGAGGGVWGDLWTSLPIYPATLPDPSKNSFANGSGVGSIALASNESIFGYDRLNRQNAKATLILDYNIRAVEGLSAKAFINYDKGDAYGKNFSKPYQFYTYNYGNDTYTLAGSLGSQAKLSYSTSQLRNVTGQFSLNYNRVFKNDHKLTVLALYEVIDNASNTISAGRESFLTPAIEELFAGSPETSTANSSSGEGGRSSYVGRINYSYKDKYIIESALRADASAKFAANKRWGYFPSISASWNIDREGFIQRIKIFDQLKLSASYGSSGLDNVGNFQYLTGYNISGQWLFNSGTQPAIVTTGLANPDLSWNKIGIYNIRTDFSLWQSKLFGTMEVFYRKLSGIPAKRVLSLPSTFGATLPDENLNSQNNRGFEVSLGTSGKIGEFSYNVSANLSYSRAKWDHFEEPVYTDPDQIRLSQNSGQWVDRAVGYLSDGLFTSQQEINSLKFTYPQGNAGLRPGDVKFIDLNGDGKLDFRDQTDIGSGTAPNWMTGTTINLKFKNFDLQALVQGGFNFYQQVFTDRGSLNYSVNFYETLWTEQNNDANAFTPRIGGSSSNGLFSDHFYKKVNYLRLKTLAFGYTVPASILAKAGIKSIRVYAAGTNLLTASPLNQYYIDPEAPSSFGSGYYYPQQRTITLGLNVTL